MALTLGQWMTIAGFAVALTVYAFIDDWLYKRKNLRANGDSVNK